MSDQKPQKNIEEMRIEIDRRRLELDESKAGFEQKLLNRHLSAIITAMIAVATITVSVCQLWITTVSKEKEIEIARIGKERELEISKEKNDRDWNLKLTTFVSEKAEIIFSKDKEQRERIQQIMLVTFPAHITNTLFNQLKNSATDPGAKETWERGEKASSNLINTRRERLIDQMFSSSKDIRIAATVSLIQEYKSDSRLLAEILKYIDEGKGEDRRNGIFNTLVLFQSLDPAVLKQYREDILRFVETSRSIGSQTAKEGERVRSILN